MHNKLHDKHQLHQLSFKSYIKEISTLADLYKNDNIYLIHIPEQ